MVEHNEYIRKVLESGQLGEVSQITPERRAEIERWLDDDDLIAWQVYNELRGELLVAQAKMKDDPVGAFEEFFRGELPPIEEYRVPYDVLPEKLDITRMRPSLRRKVEKRIRERRRSLAEALETGIEDARRPLDEVRRAMFERDISQFLPDDYPEEIPTIFQDGECNIFGHICPVFFAAEAITETSTERRRGRYIPFSVKMRVVRRDNHTCQHCGKHLADNEVEFDHKIPISKGGSSEESNIRLTCYDCNREKRDSVEI